MFEWVVKVPGGNMFSFWGTWVDGARRVREPNRLSGPELCAGGNQTQAAGGAWGWADAACASQFASICKVCEWPGLLPPYIAAMLDRRLLLLLKTLAA